MLLANVMQKVRNQHVLCDKCRPNPFRNENAQKDHILKIIQLHIFVNFPNPAGVIFGHSSIADIHIDYLGKHENIHKLIHLS